MSGLFSSKPAPIMMSAPAATPAAAAPAPTTVPDVKPPAPLPDQFSTAALEARRKAQMDIMGRAGRSSTILTAPGNRGGSSDYTATKLGSAA